MASCRSESPAQVIRDTLTMDDVLRRYGLPTARNGRIPCPLHHGKDKNFSYGGSVYHCFVCGRGGDVIKFVMELFNIRFGQAVMRINEDFNLGLAGGSPAPPARSRILEERRNARKAEEQYYQRRRELLQEMWHWRSIQRVFSPFRFGWEVAIHPNWKEACDMLDRIERELEELDGERESRIHSG